MNCIVNVDENWGIGKNGKLLVNLMIDRIYLYDDHFDIFLNNSGRKGKISDYEAADIERYFDNNPDSSSITLESGTP